MVGSLVGGAATGVGESMFTAFASANATFASVNATFASFNACFSFLHFGLRLGLHWVAFVSVRGGGHSRDK